MSSQNTNHTIETLSVEVDNINERLTGIEASIKALAIEFQKKAGTNWAAVGVLLTFCGMIGWMAWAPIQHRLSGLEEHAGEDGHPHTVLLQIENLKSQINTQAIYEEKFRVQQASHAAEMRRYLQRELDEINYFGSDRWKLPDEKIEHSRRPE